MIYTVNARGNVKWDLMKNYFNLDKSQIMDTINSEFEKTVEILEAKKIEYESLKSILVPSYKRNKKEMVFCFDSSKIDSHWYGGVIFRNLIPLIDKKRKHAIFHGDLLSMGIPEEFVHEGIFKNIVQLNQTNYIHSSQYFMVYITNLIDMEINTIIKELRGHPWFIGYGDMTYANILKDLLAYCLIQACLQNKDIVIMSHEDDRDTMENVNLMGYPFVENGFKIISLEQYYYISFLEYKIESRLVDKSDLLFSLNVISTNAIDYEKFDVIIQPEKYEYIKKKNVAIMEKIGVKDLELEKFSIMLRDRLRESYIYNLEINSHNVAKFNSNIEIKGVNSDKNVKLLASFEYSTEKQQLRLISLF
ncbi:MAG: hypothetical protein WCZ27_09000 [Tissierellaceae bacterium]